VETELKASTSAAPRVPVRPVTVMVKVPPSVGGFGSTVMERMTPSTLLLLARIVSCTELKLRSVQVRAGAVGAPL
jgi:hypothetical protein